MAGFVPRPRRLCGQHGFDLRHRGIAFGNISHTYSNLITGISETTSDTRTGWTAGGGVEFALTPNILARAEYRYTDFGIYRYDSVTSFPGLTGQQEPRFNTARLGAAYKF
jgi:outer membrane immunogenic protein